jgi:ergothioneine biosynthesis protein EgtB
LRARPHFARWARRLHFFDARSRPRARDDDTSRGDCSSTKEGPMEVVFHAPQERSARGRVTQRTASALAAKSARACSKLLDEYMRVRRATEALCAPLAIEDYVVQSMPDASPAKWHLAHTTWFFEEFVAGVWLRGYEPFEPRYRELFNSYYHSVGPQHPRPERGLLSRPTVGEVLRYRARVDIRLTPLLACAGDDAALAARVALGLAHEQQHQELILTDVKHALACNPLRPAYRAAPAPPRATAARLEFLAQRGGVRRIGYEGAGFCFDNERPAHYVFVAPYRIASRPVTNAEYRDFVRDGGYRRAVLWLADGWALAQRERWQRPLYWSEGLDAEFTLGGERELDPHAPVCHLSHYEADAFARWAQARLPTEAEWELAAARAPLTGNFLESGRLHPAGRLAQPDGEGAPELSGIFGDVWEWTASPYTAYPGYAPPAGALCEYNGKFMINQLVLRGGSCATPGSHIRATYRNFFAPAARWQFSGLRLARDEK